MKKRLKYFFKISNGVNADNRTLRAIIEADLVRRERRRWKDHLCFMRRSLFIKKQKEYFAYLYRPGTFLIGQHG